jgi:hypothetical protein
VCAGSDAGLPPDPRAPSNGTVGEVEPCKRACGNNVSCPAVRPDAGSKGGLMARVCGALDCGYGTADSRYQHWSRSGRQGIEAGNP